MTAEHLKEALLKKSTIVWLVGFIMIISIITTSMLLIRNQSDDTPLVTTEIEDEVEVEAEIEGGSIEVFLLPPAETGEPKPELAETG